MTRLGILLSGRGSNFEAIARNVAAGTIDAEIPIVISNRPEARGLEVARAMGLNAISIPSKGVERETYDLKIAPELKRHGVDLAPDDRFSVIFKGVPGDPNFQALFRSFAFTDSMNASRIATLVVRMAGWATVVLSRSFDGPSKQIFESS